MSKYAEIGTYTVSMENRIYDIELEEDPEICRQQLLELVSAFRPLDQVLEELLIWKGFSGDRKNLDEKLAYAKMLFITKGVPVPRNLKSFLDGSARFDRDKKTPFQFCYAWGLSLAEAEVFFRRCCLGRGFDYHSMQDLVFAYGLREGLSYQEVWDLLDQLPDIQQGTIPEDTASVLYTEAIEAAFDRVESREELLVYLREQAAGFACNNVTAVRRIQEIWNMLTDPADGLLNQELDQLAGGQEQLKRKKKWPEETALRQILGLGDTAYFRNFSNKRSLKEILKDNPILHPLAADCFPNRNAAMNILAGKHVSYESVRKLLILLLFYRYWVEKALKIHKANFTEVAEKKRNVWLATGADGQRCQNQIDRYLDEAGYPALYYGNPYDWIFLYAMVQEEPLPALREFMMDLYLEVKDREVE